jgi:hypothetical protein
MCRSKRSFHSCGSCIIYGKSNSKSKILEIDPSHISDRQCLEGVAQALGSTSINLELPL